MGLGWDDDPNLDQRDPNELNSHLAVTFEEVLGEPDHLHSIDCIWKFSYKCFNLWKNLCYLIATTLCGICIAMEWGCTFACVAFDHIWHFTPCYKLLQVNVACFQRFFGLFVHCIMDPCCEACSHLFDAFKK